jgi:hypothetical protein
MGMQKLMADSQTTTKIFCLPGAEDLIGAGSAHALSSIRLYNPLADADACRAMKFHVWAQTPSEVWDAYRADDYSWPEMMAEECSYAD